MNQQQHLGLQLYLYGFTVASSIRYTVAFVGSGDDAGLLLVARTVTVGYALTNAQHDLASAWQRFLNGRVPQQACHMRACDLNLHEAAGGQVLLAALVAVS
jgi:hypothetical protein